MKLLFRQKEKKTLRPQRSTISPSYPGVRPSHVNTYHEVAPATMTSAERIFSLCEAVEYIGTAGVDGDIVECGVWKGGSMMAIARTLLQNQDTDRKLWLYDTFQGMSPPTSVDVDLHGESAEQLMAVADPENANSIWCRSGIDEVRHNIHSTGYPGDHVKFVVGEVENTLQAQQNLPQQIALLRLDTDWYESTRIELEQMFPRLAVGGVLIIDDYGHWKGCRQAVDEYLAKNQIRMFLHRIDYTGRIGIKNHCAPAFSGIHDAA